MHMGGRGDARASCASPLGTPLVPVLTARLNFNFFMNYVKHCFICLPSDSTVSKDAGIDPRTVVTFALAARRSNHIIQLDLIYKIIFFL
jgi:hypothetical protein